MDPVNIISAVTQKGTPGRPVYLVGGAVRDRLLGREIHDFDFTLSGDTRAIARQIADQLGGAFYPLDEERGTYRVILTRTGEDPISLDFASLRARSLEEDLAGRDFTLNAMALDLDSPEQVIDPLGGKHDLKDRILRACAPTSISDDPVRALRAVRLELSLGLQVDPNTHAQISNAPGLLTLVSPERLRDELFRILDSEHASEGLKRLNDYALLPGLLPDLVGLQGMRQSPPHIYPGWEHTLEVVRYLDLLWSFLIDGKLDGYLPDRIFGPVQEILGRFQPNFSALYANWLVPMRSPHALLVFSALYHDCAKPLTATTDPDGRIRFFNHDELGAKISARRAHALALSSAEVERIETVVKGHMRIHQLTDSASVLSPRAIYRFFRATRQAGIDIGLLTLADTLGVYGDAIPEEHWRNEIRTVATLMAAYWDQPERIVSPPRLISGNDLIQELGLTPGPILGRILDAVQEAQAAGEVNNRTEALALAKLVLNEV